jgi:preprotein translocase subunit SecB
MIANTHLPLEIVEESQNPAPAVKAKPYPLHAIQLLELRVADLAIHVDLSAPKDAEVGDFTMETGRSVYDVERKQIQVKVVVRMGMDESEKAPFKLEVALHALFEVDESRFDVKHIESWADKNAPLVLYPYVREHVYALTGRAGFPQALLPLLEIPTFKVVTEPRATK